MKSKALKIILAMTLIISSVFMLTACGGGLFDFIKGDKNNEDDTPKVELSTFGTDSWERISQVSATGKASTIYKIGDEKTITLSTGEFVTLHILGFNHDNKSDDTGKAGMTIGVKNLLSTTIRMNTSTSNTNGYYSMEMRTTTLPNTFKTLPQELQDKIIEVNKISLFNTTGIVTVCSDKLFLLSRVEIDGTAEDGYSKEGKQYEYWKNKAENADRLKALNNGLSNTSAWWTRSISMVTTQTFLRVGTDGILATASPSTTLGVSFAFCV
ncbi:MAG: DUF6273 domain-containing protein [Firmicutes bacterium]|nr:DUF6273 domain-containing protein [Bacillota bacterium]